MPLKVALVSEHASPLAAAGGTDAGGQNIYVRALAEQLGSLGHRVTVYTRRSSVSEEDRVHLGPGVEVVHVPAGPPRWLPKEEMAPLMGDFGLQLAHFWHHDPPDVVHAHYYMSGMAALAGTRRTPIPVVQTFHALAIDKMQFYGSSVRERERAGSERAVAQVADAIIALTGQESADLVEFCGVSRSRITIIPCGVDLGNFTADGPCASRSSRPRVLAASRFVERKGLDTLIEAMASVPSAELVIAGGPPKPDIDGDTEAVRLKNITVAHGVADRVDFLGQVPHAEIPALLRSADVFVCAPAYEPFGMAALEAAACGIPVVATAVGGLRETIAEGINGHLVPYAAPALLAARLTALLADQARREAFGKAALQRAERYSWTRITDEILAVYRTVLSSG